MPDANWCQAARVIRRSAFQRLAQRPVARKLAQIGAQSETQHVDAKFALGY
jgi:hypothetical protein